jgi:hypothetical protein
MPLFSTESGYISGATLVVDGGSDAAGAHMVEKYRARPARYENPTALFKVSRLKKGSRES